MRHAKSSWKYPELSDHERPLNKRGRKASIKIAKELIRLNWIPNKLYSSDSERTRETWKRMNEYMKYSDSKPFTRPFVRKIIRLEFSRELYNSKPKKIMKNIPDNLEHETVMILGHNPGCADFLEYLCGESHRMPTAATALLRIKKTNIGWKTENNWELEKLLLPREL